MSNVTDDLFDALRKDDLENFRSLLLTYGWPTHSKWSDYHLFAEAIKFGRKSIANFLLDLKCRVIKPGHANTFVHLALTYSNWRGVVLKLLDLRAPVSTVNAQGNTAVHVAFKSNADGELIDLLLKAYVKETILNVNDSEGLSVLHIACSRSDVEVVRELVYKNTHILVTRDDINAQVQSSSSVSYSRYTPLHFAVKNGSKEIVNFLLQHFNADVYKVDNNASTPLHLALECGNIEMLDCLLAHDKVHADNVNNMGFSHFMAACAGSNSAIVSEYLRLIERRPWTSADSLIKNHVVTSNDSPSPYRGYTPLHFAAEFGRLDTVRMLLAKGASFFVVSAENVTPLVTALKRGHEEVCRLLWRQYKAYRQALYESNNEDNRKRIDSKEKSVVEPENQIVSGPPILNGLTSNVVEVESPQFSPLPGFKIQKTLSTPRHGVVEEVNAMPLGFTSPPNHFSRAPPGFPSRC